jgi:glutathione S-transferase
MIILHEHPLSPYAQKVKIALFEKDVPFQTQLPDIVGGNLGEFAALNPRLEVPTLLDGDVAVFDSTIILEYIEDRWPTPALLPKSPADRARVRMVEEVCDTYYEAINWALLEIRAFGRASGALAERLTTRAAEQTAGVNAWLEGKLGGRPYFNGEAFGWGDLAVVPAIGGATMNGNAPAPGSALAAWFARVQARPSVVQTLQAAQDSLGGFEMLPQLIESGLFKREYRDHRLEWMMRSGGAEIVLEGMRKGNIRFSTEPS